MRKRSANPMFVLKESEHFERGTGKSMTVPGQDVSIEDLFLKYGSDVYGMAMNARNRNAGFPDEDADVDDPDLEKVALMDVVERDALLEETQQLAADRGVELEELLRTTKEEEKDEPVRTPMPTLEESKRE